MEIWKPTTGFEGVYENSNYGRVRSINRLDCRGYRRKGKLLKPGLDGNGYHKVSLSMDGKVKSRTIHIITAENHVPNRFEGAVVNHIDGIKTNNHHTNLEWVTQQRNTELGLAKYWLVTFPCNTEKVVYNLKKFCREHGLCRNTLWLVSRGKAIHHRGFKCKLIKEK